MSHLNYSKKSKEEVFAELKTGPIGLSDSEAKKRLEKYGYNEIITKRLRWFDILLRQVANSMFYLLIIATIISLILKQITDAFIIFIILIINIGLGFLQEYKSEKILEKLKAYIVAKAKVRREGKRKIIERRNLVPGDVVIVEIGDIIPADMRIFKSENLLVDESILTGESYPMPKDESAPVGEIKEIYEAKNLVFSGTTVVRGHGEGIVIATGKSNLMGEIIRLTTEIKHQSLFEQNIAKLSKFILKLVFFTLTIVFVINLIVKRGAIDARELLLFTIAMAISVIPEALPLVTTLTLSSGALKMAKKNVVVRRLSAIHDLGSVDILCTDKTGTITQNILTVTQIFAADKEEWLLKALMSSPYLEKQDKKFILEPFDKAIYQASSETVQNKISFYHKLWFQPFDPNCRYNTIVVKDKDQKCWLIVKGAPEEIINLSIQKRREKIIENFDNVQKKVELEKISKIGLMGQRVLAIAYKEIDNRQQYSVNDVNNLIYLGFAAFSDPLKPTAKTAIKKAQQLGISVKIITGDSREVAEVIAREVGLPDTSKRVFTGAELDKMSKEEFLMAIDQGTVFARISPIQKYKIVEALEDKYSVAFLGEGINDAPALKLTHVAMVVDSGADISKEAADIILLKKDLKVIVDGITEGRRVFSNVIKYIKYTLIGNFGNFYGMAAISLFVPFLPMLAVQIFLLNLLSDMPLVAVATDHVQIKEIAKPQKYNFHELAFFCIFLGLISSFFDLMFFAIFNRLGPEMLRTLWFIASMLTELVIIYSIRTKFFFLKGGWPSWQLIGFSFLATILTVWIPFSPINSIFHFVQPSLSNLLLIIGIVIIYFVCTEVVKLMIVTAYRGQSPRNQKRANFLIFPTLFIT
ncbi:MAG: cation-translocating P-type ATPase [Patescibacteria group bacterium]